MKIAKIILGLAFLVGISGAAVAQDNGPCTVPPAFDIAVEKLRVFVTAGDSTSVAVAADLVRVQLDAVVAGCSAPEVADTAALPANDGLSMATAFALGESGPVMSGQGSLVINRFVRGATSSNARFLSYQRPDTDQEWLIVWVTITCEQSVCDSPEGQGFFLTGDEKQIYSNLVYARGGYFDDQLKGQTLEGGKVSGWLWFQVSKTDGNLVLADSSSPLHFFALYKVSDQGASVRVIAPTTANLRACAGTTCAVIDSVANGEQLVLIEDLGEWLHVRTLEGTEGFVSAALTQSE